MTKQWVDKKCIRGKFCYYYKNWYFFLIINVLLQLKVSLDNFTYTYADDILNAKQRKTMREFRGKNLNSFRQYWSAVVTTDFFFFWSSEFIFLIVWKHQKALLCNNYSFSSISVPESKSGNNWFLVPRNVTVFRAFTLMLSKRSKSSVRVAETRKGCCSSHPVWSI